VESVDQGIDSDSGIVFGNLAEVGITRGRGWTGMTEQSLDMAQAQTLFEQMRGEGMPQ
jgi:hypothetical protein